MTSLWPTATNRSAVDTIYKGNLNRVIPFVSRLISFTLLISRVFEQMILQLIKLVLNELFTNICFAFEQGA